MRTEIKTLSRRDTPSVGPTVKAAGLVPFLGPGMYEAILVAIDRSETARVVLESAIELADGLEVTVHVLTVVEPSGSPRRFGVAEVDALNRAAERLVDDVVDAYDARPDRDVDLSVELRRGRPTEVIVAYADEIDADLLCVGRRSRGRPASVGNTTDHLVRSSPVPVVVVPDPNAD